MTVTINGTTGIAGVDGSAGTPAIQGADTNTGMFFPAADTIAFAEGGAEIARFDSSGNFAIGTTATTYNYQTKNIALYDASSAGISIVGGAKILTLTAQSGGGIFVGSRSNDDLRLVTNDTERARIDTSGNLLVGTTSVFNVGKISDYFAGNSQRGITLNDTDNSTTSNYITLYKNGTQVGTIQGNGSTGINYSSSSDYRLKNITGLVTGAKDFIMALKPKQGTWKSDGSKFVGFLAHEFQEVSPTSVSGVKDAVDADGKPIMQSMQASSSEVIANIVSFIQEQQALITAMTARIEALEAK